MFRVLIASTIAAGLLCSSAIAQYAPATPPATTPAPKPAAAPKPASGGQQAMRERQKKCGAEWKEAKAAGKVEKGMSWPKYWSACDKRLKAGG